jgi:hypothetical protein
LNLTTEIFHMSDLSDEPVQDAGRRRFLGQAGAGAAWMAVPGGLLLVSEPGHAQTASQSRLERLAAELDILARHTMAGVASFCVPGSDLYSIGQGMTTLAAPGGVAAKADAFLVYMFDHYLPLPGATQLATGLGEPFRGLSLTLADGSKVNLGGAVTEVVASLDSVPLSLLLSLLLNALALSVRPSSAVGLLPSPFARLSWRDKAKVFELLETPGSSAAGMVSQKLEQPLTRTLIGYVQLIGLGLLAFAGSGAYSEWAVLDPATRTLRSRPVGWRIANYAGVSDGWDDLKGYYQNRKEAVDA